MAMAVCLVYFVKRGGGTIDFAESDRSWRGAFRMFGLLVDCKREEPCLFLWGAGLVAVGVTGVVTAALAAVFFSEELSLVGAFHPVRKRGCRVGSKVAGTVNNIKPLGTIVVAAS